jgi:putative salt-induced outer membrane protein YdiY
VQISQFFDPAYLTQSAGVAYTPFANLTTRLGVGVREVLTSDYPRYADDPSTSEIEKTRVQGGLESVTDFKWPFAENMVFTARLEMFSPFNQMDRLIVRSDNNVAMKVNQYVTVNFNVQLINDANVTPRTQAKEALALGLSYTLL